MEGSADEPPAGNGVCPHCNGTGRVIVGKTVPLGSLEIWPTEPGTELCGVCGGDGRIDEWDQPVVLRNYMDWCKNPAK